MKKKKKQNKPNSISNHYEKSRNKRELIINQFIGNGNILDKFCVDRGHKDGAEIHSITDTGLIIIENAITGKLVTKLIARPEQIERYYRKEKRQAPKAVIELVAWHKSLQYNF